MPLPQNAKTIYEYLLSKGLSENAAAGVTGNIEQESGGNPQAGVWPTNYGLIQWTPANKYFAGPPNLQAQLAGIVAYIRENGSIDDINKHASSPSAAALYFSQQYERPLAAAANNPNRMGSAEAVAQAAASGNWKASSATPSTGITRPGGQPAGGAGSGDGSGNLQAVDQALASYVTLRDMDRQAPSPSDTGVTGPFSWWWASFTGNWSDMTTDPTTTS